MSEQVRCTPTSSIWELCSSYVHPLHGNPTAHIISIMCPSRLWLCSLMRAFLTFFVFLLYHISLFAILSVNSRDYAHPLHECSKYRKGVDQIDFYLASGLGTSQDRIPRKTKCENLVHWVLNKHIFLSYSHIPLLACQHHLETFESRTTRALAPNVLSLLVSMLI